MNKKITILIAVVLYIGAGFSSLSFAQGMNEANSRLSAMEKDTMKSEMMAKCSKCGMMMKGMMEKSIIATPDGGVIVLAGNKLIKYDKDLSVVKEAEIKIDMEAMHKNMMEMMKNCPMMKNGMVGTSLPASGTPE